MAAASASQNTCIIGLGLLGASLAAALKRKDPHAGILGVSSPNTINKALRLKLIDKGFNYTCINQAVERSSLVVLCTPITHILKTLEHWRRNPPVFRRSCIVTDVGSTKKTICNLAGKTFLKCPKATFIGSHPMAGSEKNGIEARDPHLFENASWIICPLPGTHKKALDRLQSFVETLGARSMVVSPEIHDRVVANVSHLPQLISTALAGFIANRPSVVKNSLQISGGGFRDMTRLAKSSFSVWEPIFNSNTSKILNALDDYLSHLKQIRNAFAAKKIRPMFEEGRKLGKKLVQLKKGFKSDLSELHLLVPDKPGILAEVLNHIYNQKLNVLDLEILKVREGESGTIRIAFKKQVEAEKAVSCLVRHGFEASVR